MLRLLIIALLTAMPVAHADPLKSGACGAAIAQLQAAREARAGNVEAVRQAAARTCLGQAEPSSPRSNRWAQPPLVVPPPVIELPGPPAAAATPRPLPPAVHIDRPATIGACDANGCWASDGSRLNRIGPNLVGPAGVCTIQGGLAYCP